MTASVKDDHKCSQCDVHVSEENKLYKEYIRVLESLFPTVTTDDELSTAGQFPTSISESHIVITTLSGESTTLIYNANQTILSVQSIVEQKFKTPCNKQSLLYNNTELKVTDLYGYTYSFRVCNIATEITETIHKKHFECFLI